MTHNYTGHPWSGRLARWSADGELGPIRVVQVEYAQDWLSTPLEKTGQKQAVWRTDPAQSGPGGSLGDIGTHAFNLASFVTGLNCRSLRPSFQLSFPAAAWTTMCRSCCALRKARAVCCGRARSRLGTRTIFACGSSEKRRGLSGSRKSPNYLWFAALGKTPNLIYRGGPAASPVAAHASRVPSGHPEGYLEAFAQLYADMAEQISARIDGRSADPASLYWCPPSTTALQACALSPR